MIHDYIRNHQTTDMTFRLKPTKEELEQLLTDAGYPPSPEDKAQRLADSYKYLDAAIWISIKDYKPQYYSKVLGYSEKRHIQFVWRANDGDTDIYTLFGADDVIDITHWLPLPKEPAK